jgi:hypothetical protein
VPLQCAPALSNPACVLSQYHAANLAGPRAAGGLEAWRKASFAFATPDGGDEFITLEIGPDAGAAYFLSSLVLTESAYPGAVVGISVASEYAGDYGTAWRDIFRRAAPEAQTAQSWREFAPAICPVPVRAAFVKIEVVGPGARCCSVATS